MDKVDLAYCMTLPPARAMAYLRAKGHALTWDWSDLWQEAQAQAFTVAKVTRLDILQDIRDAVDKALAQGLTQAWFAKELTPLLKAKGWWGRQDQVNPATGEVQTVQLGSPWRLKTIYRTNLQTAYMAGRFAAQLENVDDRPYWKYVAVLDGRTRPSHRAMHGKVLRYDDPFWASFYPPNGWGCRCRVVALAQRDLDAEGVRVESSTGKLGRSVRSTTGLPGDGAEVTTYRAKDPTTGRAVVVAPDAGWSYNAGAAAWTPDLSRYADGLAAIARREL